MTMPASATAKAVVGAASRRCRRGGILSKVEESAVVVETTPTENELQGTTAVMNKRGSAEYIAKRAARQNSNISQSMQVRLTETIGDITGERRRSSNLTSCSEDDDEEENGGGGAGAGLAKEEENDQIGLDAQISQIESILDPSGAALAHLTSNQIAAIEGLRDALLLGTLQLVGGYSEVNEYFVPDAILERSQSDATSTCSYIASEYGGIKMNREKPNLKTVARKIQKGASIARALKACGIDNNEANINCNLVLYAPPEWTALSLESKSILKDKLSLQALKSWDFDIFDIVKHCGGDGNETSSSPLVLVGWAILASPHAQRAMGHDIPGLSEEGYDFVDQFNVKPEVLCNFLREVEKDYVQSNPYHNNIHAADVVQSMHSLLCLGGDKYSTSPLEVYALLLAAAAHDMGHPGKNNTYQVNARTDQALYYNDQSVLEHMHSSRAFNLLLGASRRSDIDVLGGLEEDQVTAVRTLMVGAILDTDMSKHFAHVNHISSAKDAIVKNIDEKGHDVLRFMLHLADISNPAKPNVTSVQWADRALNEFFAQGDAEKEAGLPVSPLCDRNKEDKADSQVGFIQFVVKPAFELLGEFVPKVKEVVLPVVEDNLAFWEKQKEYRAMTKQET